MTSLVIIRGLPGSGKSTLAQKHFPHHWHVESDQFFVTSGVYKFDGTKLSEAHRWCRERVAALLATGWNVAVSNTFTTNAEIGPYLDIAKKHMADVTVIECLAQYKDIHGVPDETFNKMKARWEPFDRHLGDL
jgi:predicted kinase